MTGVEFGEILDLRIDKGYSAFLTPIEKNRIIREATIRAIVGYYNKLGTQSDRDSLTTFIKTGIVFSLSGNQISTITTGSPSVTDYDSVFAVKAKFNEQLYGLTISGATNTNPIIITVGGNNNLRTGELISIDNIIGNPAANGTFYIKKIKSTQFSLYTDMFLQTTVSGNGDYVSGGTISRVFYNYCLPIVSDKKIDPYAKATVRIPRFEIADTYIKITPSEYVCNEITMDYLVTPSTAQLIDVTNAVINYENIYPIGLLYDIANSAANLFAQAFKDGELFSTSNFEAKKNE